MRAMLWVVAALALDLAPVMAADQGVSVYPAEFFSSSHPATARDMISRLPGFVFDQGDDARGFAGSAGNVLVDGARPTAKTDDLDTILSRIPADNVERIELIRGGVPGIDMQGKNVIANVVRKTQDSGQTILTLGNTLIEDGEWVPAARLEYHGRRGAISYEGSLARTADQWDDSPGNGYRRVTDASGVTYDHARSYGIMQLGWAAHGGITAPLLGGEWNNNFTLQTTDFSNGIAYSGDGGSRFDNTARKRNGEFGSHWKGFVLGDVNLETLVLERVGDEHDSNTDAAPGLNEAFLANSSSGETIGRVTARYAVMPTLNIEAGGEAAYNFLDGGSSYNSNGAAIALPNANVFVDERRGELFANATWKITPTWSLEGGARLEYSNIAESGDTNLSRSFFYAKPRALLTWDADDQTQIRARAELKVGQLNFSDFVASSDLNSFGVSGGNANLRPEQRWQAEAAIERRFLGKGALVLTLLHEDITDLQDYVPIGGGLDGPGNIAHALSDTITLAGTVPLDWLGIPNALLKPNLSWNFSSLRDPVTGQNRPISGQRDHRLTFEFDQDLPDWRSSWGFGFQPISQQWHNYRIDQISKIGIHVPYTYLFWTYNPAPDWNIKIQGDNVTPYRFELEQDIYAGPRNLSPLSRIQDAQLRTRPRLFVQLRKTL
ncbi:MAG: TonB-dependent receptor [Alphaproteobacteria bacterium]|nr:TonB-dependent receptor [Alphaproteobacteria bacterium]MDB5740807.1 TonB-dependent receptor [Alphaproteobacteria bacterium]